MPSSSDELPSTDEMKLSISPKGSPRGAQEKSQPAPPTTEISDHLRSGLARIHERDMHKLKEASQRPSAVRKKQRARGLADARVGLLEDLASANRSGSTDNEQHRPSSVRTLFVDMLMVLMCVAWIWPQLGIRKKDRLGFGDLGSTMNGLMTHLTTIYFALFCTFV